jgi:predicted aconitase
MEKINYNFKKEYKILDNMFNKNTKITKNLEDIDVKLTETPVPWYTKEEMEVRQKLWKLSQKIT